MAKWAQSLVIIGLTLAPPAATGNTLVRLPGVSSAAATLATGAAAPYAADAQLRRVSAQMRGTPRKLAQAGAPLHAHPSGPATPPLPHVNTGGTRINTDGLATGAGTSGVSGAVGEQQYVQLVGASMAVYRKQDGALHFGPANVHALFAGSGVDACTTPGSGAPQVLYDQLDKRWLVSWLAGAPGRHVQCIAISTTADATGSYYRYALRINGAGGAALLANDARIALWHDAYLLTFTLFDNAQGAYLGPRICAVERQALVRGRAAALRCKDPGAAFGPAIAASLEGASAPPRRTPVPVLSLDFTDAGAGSRLLLWRFGFASASMGDPVAIPVAPFRLACGAAGNACIGQPHPGAALFAASDRLMPQISYRHHAGQETLLVAHAVQHDDGATGMRWYELRSVAQGVMHASQQGTHAPDAEHRRMGSIGSDKAGNIALGLAVAGPDTPPGLRYTGRHRSDPPGRMQREEFIVNGSGVQPGSARHLAASGALTLDPADGCTFWYTQHYLPVTGEATWRTRIASFKFCNCM